MKSVTRLLTEKRALRLISVTALALFFYICGAALLLASSADVLPQPPGLGGTLSGYIEKMLLALALFAAIAFAAAKFLPKLFKTGNAGRLCVLGAMSLGRDAVYILQIGPDVVALFVGKSGPALLGRWSMDEWEDYEASLGEGTRSGETKGNSEFL